MAFLPHLARNNQFLFSLYRVNCSFYFKIGACRHGDRCSRLHNKPTFSQTIALLNIYRNPQNSSQSADGLRCAVSDVEMQEHYDEFFEVSAGCKVGVALRDGLCMVLLNACSL